MVWPMQNSSSDTGADSTREERQVVDRQAERRRRDEHRAAVRRDEYSDADSFQRRSTGSSGRWGEAQRGTSSRSGTTPITFDSSEPGPSENDVYARLTRLGFETDDLTHRILAFQASRALPLSGICDAHTWKALLEADYRLGDRLVYLRTPLTRGEDVAELQNRLGLLGFDAGRVDGIFGPDTQRALKEFQRNAGLPVDGICGPTTVEELRRVFGRSPTNVHSVKELESVRSQNRALTELTVSITHEGFMDAPAEMVRSALANKGARAQINMHPDPSHLAKLSNVLEADICIHLEEQDRVPQVRYYKGFSYSSSSGELLANLLARHMNSPSCGLKVSPAGINVPVLRETHMTAVSLSIFDASFWVRYAPQAAKAITDAITEWTSSDFRHQLSMYSTELSTSCALTTDLP